MKHVLSLRILINLREHSQKFKKKVAKVFVAETSIWCGILNFQGSCP